MIRTFKRSLAQRYPEWVAAYHEAKMRRRLRHLAPAHTPFGFRFAGPAGMQDGTFEPDETAFLQERLPAADVFVDIGANVGFYVCLARQRGKHVLAIEPAAANLDMLFQNLTANGWSDVEVYPLGVGSEPGLATLYGDGTGASLVTRWAGVSEAWRRTIPLSTIDALLAGRFAGQRLLMKMDIEGFEHEALRGATATLARVPTPCWLVEVCFSENFPDGINPHYADIFEMFWSRGYSAASLEAGRPVTRDDVRRWIGTGVRDFGYVSFVFEQARG